MLNLFASLPLAAQMATDDYVGFTFFVGCMAMMAASAFFFLSMNGFDKKMENFYFGLWTNYFHCRSTLLVHERLLGRLWRITHFLQVCRLDFNSSINVR